MIGGTVVRLNSASRIPAILKMTVGRTLPRNPVG
jgi:hypothetical protein